MIDFQNKRQLLYFEIVPGRVVALTPTSAAVATSNAVSTGSWQDGVARLHGRGPEEDSGPPARGGRRGGASRAAAWGGGHGAARPRAGNRAPGTGHRATCSSSSGHLRRERKQICGLRKRIRDMREHGQSQNSDIWSKNIFFFDSSFFNYEMSALKYIRLY